MTFGSRGLGPKLNTETTGNSGVCMNGGDAKMDHNPSFLGALKMYQYFCDTPKRAIAYTPYREVI